MAAFLQYNETNCWISVDDEYGVIEGKIFYCVGDDPAYAGEYPALASVDSDHRIVLCLPDVPRWQQERKNHNDPHPHRFEVADDTLVWIRMPGSGEGFLPCRADEAANRVEELFTQVPTQYGGVNGHDIVEVAVQVKDVLNVRLVPFGKSRQGYLHWRLSLVRS